MPSFDHLSRIPDGPFRFIALDVETANADRASICQIGLCFVGFDDSLRTYSVLVDPAAPFAAFNSELHGIDARRVAGAAVYRDVYADLYETLNANKLVQHSRFDERAMTAACARAGVPMITSHWSDSVQIARAAWPELRGAGGHGLANLKKHLGLSFHHHDAGEDARASASVVLHAERMRGGWLPHLAPERQLAFDFN